MKDNLNRGLHFSFCVRIIISGMNGNGQKKSKYMETNFQFTIKRIQCEILGSCNPTSEIILH